MTYKCLRPACRILLRRFTVVAFLVLTGIGVTAQGLVQISVPPMVSFDVLDVGVSTVGSPTPTRVSFNNAVLLPGQVLRISVKADGNFAPPSGNAIPASKVSWTTSNTASGIGLNGVLSAAAFTPVFESQAGAISGGVDVTWTLAAPGAALRAGNHQVTLRWKLEAVTP
jgi:hypothetical protein